MGFLSDLVGSVGDLGGDLLGGVGNAFSGLADAVGSINPQQALLASLAFASGQPELIGANMFGDAAGAAALGGDGAFLGEGVSSGIGAWDSAAAGSAFGSGEFGTALGYLGQNPLSALGSNAGFGNLLNRPGGGGLLGQRASGLGNGLDVMQGLYGLNNARRLRQQSDPFAQYRQGYGQQLAALAQNPAGLTSLPGYQAGLQAVQRQAAAGGYAGSGNELAALSQYGGQFYQNEANRLATLAGAGQSPGAGLTNSALLTSGSLKSLTGGLRGFFGGGG